VAKKSKKSHQPKEKGKRSWKLLGTTAALTAAFATTKALNAAWKTATGKEPPDSPESPEIGGREALAWAAVSGMAMGVAKMYATRRAASYWVRSFGTLPPGMNKGATKKTKQKVKT
jgi:uncharacterized protein DUF4235